MSTANFPTKGWLALRGGVVTLQARGGMWWPIDRVTFLQRFGSVHEGATKLPRPRVFDDTGRQTAAGDVVLIEFPDGNPAEPVVVGTAVDCKADAFLQRKYNADGSGFNRVAVRVAPRDRNDQELGDVELEIARDDKGTVELWASDKLEIEVGPESARVTITVENGQVTIRATTKVVVDAPDVELGTAASEGVLKGLTAQGIFDTHTHATAFGPTATPNASLSPAVSSVVTTA